MTFHIHPLPTDMVTALRKGGTDAYGQKPEHAISDGKANPCRHCLQDIPEGAGMLILALRPFADPQPYAETGPIFLCADDCDAWSGGDDEIPPILQTSPDYLIKGYFGTERIAYGTGRIAPSTELAPAIAAIFEREDVDFVDIRSARNNCFQARARRA
ncbi:DUF1203 domain-containing protein [Pseudooceanicola sp. C21-150M6]|uniref:DUF1203 domain-containing protein n=1 Tax=Pseudooceanicola sp. C21-150M6 TaxID=3434355 RepID=UPI003D7FC9E9